MRARGNQKQLRGRSLRQKGKEWNGESSRSKVKKEGREWRSTVADKSVKG
jgi:hypothetical protein